MNKIHLVAFIFTALISLPVLADQHVNGYMRSDGTYVKGYTRSDPDGTVTDNFSFKGNNNPYTGETGTNRYTHDATSPYFEGPDNNGNIGHDGAGSVEDDDSSGDSEE